MSPTIIVILVMAMLVGSLAWLLPSPRERKQMELRQVATKAGLKVKTTDLETVIDESRGQAMHCIAYGLSRALPATTEPWQTARERSAGERSLANKDLPAGWHWSLGVLPADTVRHYLQTILPTLSSDVLAIESNPISCIIYWREHGTIDDVKKIVTILKTLDGLESSLQ